MSKYFINKKIDVAILCGGIEVELKNILKEFLKV